MSTTMSTATIYAIAGRPYGHVPGHCYRDVEIECRDCRGRWIATLTVTWGSSQGYDEEHGRLEYSARGATAEDAIERVSEETLDDVETDDDALRGYIHTATSRALRDACELCEEA